MQRWSIFGLAIMLAFVAAANLTGPRAWAADSQAQIMTVPTKTPKPPDTPVPVTKPPKEPTDTPVPAPTDTPVIVQPTNTAIVVPPTKTATSTSTPAPSSTAPAATATRVTPSPTATIKLTSTAVAPTTPTMHNNASVAPVASATPDAVQHGDSTSGDTATSGWLLIPAAALIILGVVLLFGRRSKLSNK